MHALLTLFPAEEGREWRATAQRKTNLSVLSNPIVALRQHEHEQALSFLTCEEKRRMDWGPGKAPQRVNAWIRHLHREHSALTNPTCALRASFVLHTFHLSFDVCQAKKVNARTPNESNDDNPSVLTEQPQQTQCMRVT